MRRLKGIMRFLAGERAGAGRQGCRVIPGSQLRSRWADGPEQDRIRGEVFPLVAHPRRMPEGFKRIEQFSGPAIGGFDVIGSDVFPNLVEIEAASAPRT